MARPTTRIVPLLVLLAFFSQSLMAFSTLAGIETEAADHATPCGEHTEMTFTTGKPNPLSAGDCGQNCQHCASCSASLPSPDLPQETPFSTAATFTGSQSAQPVPASRLFRPPIPA